jgi:shikimate kinase
LVSWEAVKQPRGKNWHLFLAGHLSTLIKKLKNMTGKIYSGDLFSENGEEYFRITESRLLRKLDVGNNTVISTGGGTPCYSDNMDIMLESGLTIYLKLTPLQLRSRLSESKGEQTPDKRFRSGNACFLSSTKNYAAREKYGMSRSDITA